MLGIVLTYEQKSDERSKKIMQIFINIFLNYSQIRRFTIQIGKKKIVQFLIYIFF